MSPWDHHNIIKPCEYVNIFHAAPPRPHANKVGIFINIHAFMLNLEVWVKLCSHHYAHASLFIPTILAINIVHPSNICWNLLFITTL